VTVTSVTRVSKQAVFPVEQVSNILMAILTKVVRVDIEKFAPIRFSISSKGAVMSEVVMFIADCDKRTGMCLWFCAAFTAVSSSPVLILINSSLTFLMQVAISATLSRLYCVLGDFHRHLGSKLFTSFFCF